MKIWEQNSTIVFRQEKDGPWKQALDHFLQPFMEFHFPQYAKQIDWSHGYIPLDKELAKLAPDSENGNAVVDKLYQVRLLNGKTK